MDARTGGPPKNSAGCQHLAVSARRNDHGRHPRQSRLGEGGGPLRIIGAILLAAGLTHLYADRVVFDAPAFAARAALSLGDPRVASFVAERITDEVIAPRPDGVPSAARGHGPGRRQLQAIPSWLSPGLRELFMIVPPRVREAARHAEAAIAEAQKGHREGFRTVLHHALVGLLALGLIGGAIFFLRSPAALPEAPAFTDACNGDRSLCDRRLDELVLAGAHNSMSAAELPGWLFPNQEKGSVSLLDHGIRALLFDVHNGVPFGNGVKTELDDEAASRAKFEKVIGKEAVDAAMRARDQLTGPPSGPRAAYLCHGFCELGATPLVSMLEGVHAFLVEHPGEVLVFVIEDYVTPADIAAAFAESGLERFVYRGDVRGPWPTLRQMIDSGQRVVVFAENDAAGVPWYHPAFETIQETPYTFHAPGEFSCRPNRGGTTGRLFQINHWIETTPAPKPSNAEIVNAHDFLLARARECQVERGKLPNILAVDFAMTGDAVGVATEMNGLERPTRLAGLPGSERRPARTQPRKPAAASAASWVSTAARIERSRAENERSRTESPPGITARAPRGRARRARRRSAPPSASTSSSRRGAGSRPRSGLGIPDPRCP